MKLDPGTILKFTPYYFNNSSDPKNKYFLVLGRLPQDEDSAILASLPTSKDHIPRGKEVEHGCVELPEADFNCFVISNKKVVTTCGKNFPLTTFLEGHNLQTKSEKSLISQYQIIGVDYMVWGLMDPVLFASIKDCFLKSDRVKNKYKRALAPE